MSQVLKHRHFIGSAHSFEIITPEDPTAGQYVRPDVTILKTFFINDKVNVNKWKATWEGLKKDAEELPGVPLVLQEDLQHPKYSVQEMFDRGTIFDYEIDEENHKIIVYVRITDPSIVERIKSGELQYVSPAVIPRGDETLHKEGDVDVLDRTLPLHLCIVGEPAYGKDEAKMTHLCSGDGKECYHRLKTMTAAKKWKDEEEKKADGHGSGGKSKLKKHQSNITSLEQIPYIKKMLASTARITSTLNKIKTGSVLFEHDGVKGRWIIAQGMDVFVAENQSIKDAMIKQCGCASLSNPQ